MITTEFVSEPFENCHPGPPSSASAQVNVHLLQRHAPTHTQYSHQVREITLLHYYRPRPRSSRPVIPAVSFAAGGPSCLVSGASFNPSKFPCVSLAFVTLDTLEGDQPGAQKDKYCVTPLT